MLAFLPYESSENEEDRSAGRKGSFKEMSSEFSFGARSRGVSFKRKEYTVFGEEEEKPLLALKPLECLAEQDINQEGTEKKRRRSKKSQ